MAKLSENANAENWLKQFSGAEKEVAASLIDQILLVSRDSLASQLQSLIQRISADDINFQGPIALFAEREIIKSGREIPAYFENTEKGRANGSGAPPIMVDPKSQEVGSEGIIANIITDYCRQNRENYISHPGPSLMRAKRVRQIVILTDFIGSGQRLVTMLESFSKVATIRSWRSYHLIRFVIIAYSGTSKGIRAVRSHKLQPVVTTFIGCPTITSSFTGALRSNIISLCKTYPKQHDFPLGYKDSGALIAFAHGCPNNVPPIIHSKKNKWTPLFPGRSTTISFSAFSDLGEYGEVNKSCQTILNAQMALDCGEGKDWIYAMLILAVSGSRSPNFQTISAQTHIPLVDVERVVKLSKEALWLNDAMHLTELGRMELDRLRRRRSKSPLRLAIGENELYYPTGLRGS